MFDDDSFETVNSYGYERGSGSMGHGFSRIIGEIPLQITAEIGRTKLTVSDILKLQVGSIVELDKLSSDPVDIRVNSKLIGRGDVVSVDDCYGVRVTGILGRKY